MNTNKKLTWAEHLKLRYDGAKQVVISSCGITDEELFWKKTDMGLAFLEYQLDGDQFGYNLLYAEPMFWHWFNNEWAKRDVEFVRNYGLNYGQKPAASEYYRYHFSAMYGQHMNAAYESTIQQIINIKNSGKSVAI